MKHENLMKKLENISFKESIIKSHKRRLKAVLMPASKIQYSFSKAKNIFDLQKKYFRKVLIFGSLALLILFMSLNKIFFQPSQTAFARQIINQALIDISKLQPPDQASREKIQFIANILEEAQKSHELQYLGEEKNKNGIIKKLKFTDEDLSQDVIIQINIDNPLLDAIDFEFTDELHMPFDVISGAVKNGKIIDKEILTAQLLDPSIKKHWIKDLIQQRNQTCLQKLKNISSSDTFTPSKDQETLSKELISFISSAEVLVINCHEGWSYDQNGTLNQFHLSVYSFGNQKKKMMEAQKIIDQAIEKLSLLNSREAQEKIELLKKAKNSKKLRYSLWREQSGDRKKHLTFLDKTFSSTAIDISIDSNNPSVEAVQFRFRPDLNSEESRNITQIVRGSFENTTIENQILFKDKDLQNDPNRDLILRLIVRPQNEETFYQNLSAPGIDQSVMKSLKPIIESSELLLLGIPYYSKNSEGIVDTFAFHTYSFGAQKKYQAHPELWKIDSTQLLDAFILKMSKSHSQEAKSKISTLAKLKEAQYVGYDGDMMYPDKNGIFEPDQRGIYNNINKQSLLHKRFQRYRFIINFEGKKIYTAILVDPDDDSEASIKIESFISE